MAPSRRPGLSFGALGAAGAGALGSGGCSGGAGSGGWLGSSASRCAGRRGLRRGRAWCLAHGSRSAVRPCRGRGLSPTSLAHRTRPERRLCASRLFACTLPDRGVDRRVWSSPASPATAIPASATARIATTPAATNRVCREKTCLRPFSFSLSDSICDGAAFSSSLTSPPVRSSSSLQVFTDESAVVRSSGVMGSSADIRDPSLDRTLCGSGSNLSSTPYTHESAAAPPLSGNVPMSARTTPSTVSGDMTPSVHIRVSRPRRPP